MIHQPSFPWPLALVSQWTSYKEEQYHVDNISPCVLKSSQEVLYEAQNGHGHIRHICAITVLPKFKWWMWQTRGLPYLGSIHTREVRWLCILRKKTRDWHRQLWFTLARAGLPREKLGYSLREELLPKICCQSVRCSPEFLRERFWRKNA